MTSLGTESKKQISYNEEHKPYLSVQSKDVKQLREEKKESKWHLYSEVQCLYRNKQRCDATREKNMWCDIKENTRMLTLMSREMSEGDVGRVYEILKVIFSLLFRTFYPNFL